MRINVVGTSGSGKSTFARRIAEELKVPYIEMDALFWKPNWTESTDEEFFPRLEKALSSDEWVLDGNYSRTQPIVWERVQTVVYLDLPFHIVIFRIIYRSLIHGLHRTELWAGNRATIRKNFLSRDSIILYAISSFHRFRKRYEGLFSKPEHSHIRFVRLRSNKEVEHFITHRLPKL